jgi:hypothetical protein
MVAALEKRSNSALAQHARNGDAMPRNTPQQ